MKLKENYRNLTLKLNIITIEEPNSYLILVMILLLLSDLQLQRPSLYSQVYTTSLTKFFFPLKQFSNFCLILNLKLIVRNLKLP